MRILLAVEADVSAEHAEGMLEDLATHVQRYNPRVIETVTASAGTAVREVRGDFISRIARKDFD